MGTPIDPVAICRNFATPQDGSVILQSADSTVRPEPGRLTPWKQTTVHVQLFNSNAMDHSGSKSEGQDSFDVTDFS